MIAFLVLVVRIWHRHFHLPDVGSEYLSNNSLRRYIICRGRFLDI